MSRSSIDFNKPYFDTGGAGAHLKEYETASSPAILSGLRNLFI